MHAVLLVGIVIGLMALGGCKSPNEAPEPVLVEVRLMEYDSAQAAAVITQNLNDLPAVDVGGELAVKLADLVPVTLVKGYTDKTGTIWDRRPLYTYRLVGSDGFRPDNRIDSLTGRYYENLNWARLGHGYIKRSSRDVAYDATLQLPGRYGVRDVAAIEIFRKVDVISGPDTVQVELAAVERTPLGDTLAVRLADILSVVDSSAAHQHVAVAVDGFSNATDPFTWAQIQTGYWFLALDRTSFDPDLGIGGKQRISHVIQIVAQ